jgi:hypothetical protein
MTFSLFGETDDDDDSSSSSGTGSSSNSGEVSKNRRDFRNVSVLAGHFTWDIWRDLDVARDRENDLQTRDLHDIQRGGDKNKKTDTDTGQAGCVVFAKDGSCLLHPARDTAEAPPPNPNPNPSKTAGSSSPPLLPLPLPLPPQRKKGGSCFVVGRHPIERVLAYYYHRCFKNKGCVGYGRYFNDLSVQELVEIESTFRDIGSRRPLEDPTTQV